VSKKLTLNEKILLNEHVTGETKRCLSITKKILSNAMDIITQFSGELVKDEDSKHLLDLITKEIIEGSPYIGFHPKLLKRIPKIKD